MQTIRHCLSHTVLICFYMERIYLFSGHGWPFASIYDRHFSNVTGFDVFESEPIDCRFHCPNCVHSGSCYCPLCRCAAVVVVVAGAGAGVVGVVVDLAYADRRASFA